MNTIPTLNNEMITLLKDLEAAAVAMLSNGYDSLEVFEMCSNAYGEPLGVDVVRMVVNSAQLLADFD
jgi:hypothetical protein